MHQTKTLLIVQNVTPRRVFFRIYPEKTQQITKKWIRSKCMHNQYSLSARRLSLLTFNRYIITYLINLFFCEPRMLTAGIMTFLLYIDTNLLMTVDIISQITVCVCNGCIVGFGSCADSKLFYCHDDS